MLGYTVDEFPTDVYQVCDLIHPDDYESTMQIMRNHLYGDSPNYIVTYRILRKDGSYAWYFDRGAISERDEKGSPKKVIGSVIDVSIMKTMEKELSVQNLMLRESFNLDDYPRFIIDKNNNILHVNKKFNDYFEGYFGDKISNPEHSWIFTLGNNTPNKDYNPLTDKFVDKSDTVSINLHVRSMSKIMTLEIKASDIYDTNGMVQAVSVKVLS